MWLYLFSLTTYVGGCVYIALVDMPALGMLAPQSYLGVFSAILPRAGRLMLPTLLLALLSGLAGAALVRPPLQYWLLAGGGLLFVILAMTALLIVPLNAELLSAGHLGDGQIRAIRSQWGTWHGLRTVLSVLALALALAGMSWQTRG
jgi:uncharacterized membrane protein